MNMIHSVPSHRNEPKSSSILDWLLSPAIWDEVSANLSYPAAQPYWETAFIEPLRVFFESPGKGLRKELVELGWTLANQTGEVPFDLVAGIELLHAGSLIIDDVQDDSLNRRGQPCLHRTIGVGPALNLGNWLYFVAAHAVNESHSNPVVVISMQKALTETLLRCHNGQALDLSLNIHELEQASIGQLVGATTRLKTGALTALSLRLGGLYGGLGAEYDQQMHVLGETIGVALQMYDDLSGIMNPARRDKGREDLRTNRPTWPWAWLAQSMEPLDFKRLQLQCQNLDNDAQVDACLDRLAEHLLNAPQFIVDQLDSVSERIHAMKPDGKTRIDEFIGRLKASYL